MVTSSFNVILNLLFSPKCFTLFKLADASALAALMMSLISLLKSISLIFYIFKDQLVIPSADLSQSLFKAYFANTMIVDVCHIDISLLVYSQPTRRREFCRRRIAVLVSGNASGKIRYQALRSYFANSIII